MSFLVIDVHKEPTDNMFFLTNVKPFMIYIRLHSFMNKTDLRRPDAQQHHQC